MSFPTAQEIEKKFLCIEDYGTGGSLLIIRAGSRQELEAKFPGLGEIVEQDDIETHALMLQLEAANSLPKEEHDINDLPPSLEELSEYMQRRDKLKREGKSEHAMLIRNAIKNRLKRLIR